MKPDPINLHAYPVRVSIFTEFGEELWQATLQDFCRATQRTPDDTMRYLETTQGLKFTVEALHSDYIKQRGIDLDRMMPRHPLRPDDVLYLRRTHYYQDQETGTLYTSGDKIRSGLHWDKHGPIRATMGQSQAKTPLVTIHTGFGIDGDYTPEQLERFGQALIKIAGDAKKSKMGPRSFHRSVRGYDV